jgi:hypothetical protein
MLAAQLEQPVSPGGGLAPAANLASAHPVAASLDLEGLDDPGSGEPEHDQQRTAAVALVLRDGLLPLACDVEHVEEHVGHQQRPALSSHLQPAARAARGVRRQDVVVDGVVERHRQQVEEARVRNQLGNARRDPLDDLSADGFIDADEISACLGSQQAMSSRSHRLWFPPSSIWGQP